MLYLFIVLLMYLKRKKKKTLWDKTLDVAVITFECFKKCQL